MSSNSTTNTPNDDGDGGFISFNNDNSSSNWRKTPFKSYTPHQNLHEQFSPQGSPQKFSSPIYNQRNFHGNRRQSGNSYEDRFRGNNQSHNRGNNWKNRNDNRRPFNNRSFNQSGHGTGDISDYFHPSMIQDPWKHFQQNFAESNATIDKNFEDSSLPTKNVDEPGGDGAVDSSST